VSTRPLGANAAQARQAFAGFLGTVAAAWPVPGAGPPANSGELLALGETLLDPRMLVVYLVSAAVQAAALHAGIPLVAAHAIGQVAGNEVDKLLGPDPAARKVQRLQVVNLTLSADNRSAIEKALQTTDMAAGEINRLLSISDPPPPAPRVPGLPSPADHSASTAPVGASPPSSPAARRLPSPSVPASSAAQPPAGPGQESSPSPQISPASDPRRHPPPPGRGLGGIG
jgi:hypothetical protein